MKNIFRIIGIFCLIFMYSCQVDTMEDNVNGLQIERVVITGNDFVSNLNSRTTKDGDLFRWVKTDTLGIFPSLGGYQVAFPLDDMEGEEAKSATFTGGGWALISGAKYMAYYPFSYNNRKPSSIPVTFSNQKNVMKDEQGKLVKDKYYWGHYDYMYAIGNAPSSGQVDFSFEHLVTLLQLQVTMPTDEVLTAIEVISSSNETFVKDGYFDLTVDGIPEINSIQKSNSLTLDFSINEEVEANTEYTYYLCSAPIELKGDDLTIKVYSTTKSYIKTFTNLTLSWKAGSYTPINLKDFTEISDLWDGEISDEKLEAEQDGSYLIETALQLAQFAKMVNEGESFDGKTVKLANNIDLNGNEWTPIGYTGTYFAGIFDGNGKSISNFKITQKHHSDKNAQNNQAAFFGVIAGDAILKNFTINEAQILYPESETGDFYGAAVVGTCYGNHTFENINVTNSTIQGNNKVAGLLAHDGSSSSITIKNCHVSGCTIETKNEKDGGNVAGLVGVVQTSGAKIEDSTVKNCTINAINSSDSGKRGNSQLVGSVIAKKENFNITISNCTVLGNEFNETGRSTYVSPYGDGTLVGGAREGSGYYVGIVYIDGTEYPIKPVTMNGKGYNTIAEAVSGMTGNEATLSLTEGTFTLPTSLSGKTLIFEGTSKEKTVIDMSDGSSVNQYNAVSVTFKNLMMKRKVSDYGGLTHTQQEHYDNCIIEGTLVTYATNISVTNSEFIPSSTEGYNMHIYEGGTVSVKDCKFTTTASRSVYAYAESDKEMHITFENCDFISNTAANDFRYHQAIRLHTEYGIHGTLTISECTVNDKFNPAYNNGLWVEWNNGTKELTDNFVKTIDGKKILAGGIRVVNNVYTVPSTATSAKFETIMDDINVDGYSYDAITINLEEGANLSYTTMGQSGTYYVVTNGVTKTVTIIGQGEGAKLEFTGQGVSNFAMAEDAKLILKNLEVEDKSESYNEAAWEFTYLEFGGAMEVTGCSFDKGIMLAGDADALFTECKFKSQETGVYALWILDGKATFNKCTFNGTRGAKTHEAYGADVESLSFEECVFNALTEKPGLVIGTLDANTSVSIKNSRFISCQPGDQGLYIYETDTDVTTFTFINENNIAGDYFISNLEELMAFAKSVNNEGNNYQGKVVTLTADIDLENNLWTPVGQTGATQFMGTFDGNDKTLSNLSVDATDQTGGDYSSGIFGWLNKAIVKNVKVDGAVVKGNHNVGVIAGYLETEGCTILNCHVSDADVECHVANSEANGDKCGVIVGHAGNTGVAVKECTATDSEVSAGRDAGQIVGAAKTANVINCSATNVTVVANGEGTGANINDAVIGRVL